MNTKNMPRFTAEASLYNTHKRYSVMTSEAELASGQGIVPQMRMSLDFIRVFRSADGGAYMVCTYDDVTSELISCDIFHQ